LKNINYFLAFISILSISFGSLANLFATTVHGRRQRRQGGRAPWIFIHGADEVEGGFMVLVFGLVFSVGHPPENFSADALTAILLQLYDLQLSSSLLPVFCDCLTF